MSAWVGEIQFCDIDDDKSLRFKSSDLDDIEVTYVSNAEWKRQVYDRTYRNCVHDEILTENKCLCGENKDLLRLSHADRVLNLAERDRDKVDNDCQIGVEYDYNHKMFLTFDEDVLTMPVCTDVKIDWRQEHHNIVIVNTPAPYEVPVDMEALEFCRVLCACVAGMRKHNSDIMGIYDNDSKCIIYDAGTDEYVFLGIEHYGYEVDDEYGDMMGLNDGY